MAVSMTMPILIVDDYNTMIRILRNLLRQLGFSNIDEANDGAAALAKMRTKDYALVISDANMGLQSSVRGDARMSKTPIVMVANDNGAAPDAAAYIVAPFNAQALKSKLVSVIGAF
ncbi:response regulator [Terricaulis sp.]|uniref:response regulator n=1 Tax=Terricaulis sp. TaxID=2768686 RepID=UPI000B071033|nr:response regulator [Terricaulis sp.]MDZ4692564.1 response regulator [Terricaulis sp.]